MIHRYLQRLVWSTLTVLVTVNTTAAQYSWMFYENNPVIDFDWDVTSSSMLRPAVLSIDGRLHMWYGKQLGINAPRAIGYSTSEDGIEWTLVDLFAFEGRGDIRTFDDLLVTDPAVVQDNDTLRMWYFGLGRIAGFEGIGYAWSVNGSDWTRVKGAGVGESVFDATMVPNSLRIGMPTVLKLGETYHMWYANFNSDGHTRIGYATSHNGVMWEVIHGNGLDGTVVDLGGSQTFDASHLWYPAVLYNGEKGIFEMWYQGVDAPEFGGIKRLGCARSSDGVTWEKIPGNADALACVNSLAEPAVVLDRETYRMWYSITIEGDPGSANNDIINYATSEPVSTAAETNEVPNLSSSLIAYPNPFQGSVSITFDVESAVAAELEVRDILGRLVYHEDLGHTHPGTNLVRWSGRNEVGSTLPPGAYLIQLLNEDGDQMGTKMVQMVH